MRVCLVIAGCVALFANFAVPNVVSATGDSAIVKGAASAPADGKTEIMVEVSLPGAQDNVALALRQIGDTQIPLQIRAEESCFIATVCYSGALTPIQKTEAGVLNSIGTNARTVDFYIRSNTPSNSVTLVPYIVADSWHHIAMQSYDNLAVTIAFTRTSAQLPHPVASISPPSYPSPTPAPTNCAPHTNNQIVGEAIGQFFCFAGLNLRVDSVQTVDKADNSPLLTRNLTTQQDPDLGYIVVKVTMQNRSNSQSQTYPGNWLGFDFADGSKMELGVVSA